MPFYYRRLKPGWAASWQVSLSFHPAGGGRVIGYLSNWQSKHIEVSDLIIVANASQTDPDLVQIVEPATLKRQCKTAILIRFIPINTSAAATVPPRSVCCLHRLWRVLTDRGRLGRGVNREEGRLGRASTIRLDSGRTARGEPACIHQTIKPT